MKQKTESQAKLLWAIIALIFLALVCFAIFIFSLGRVPWVQASGDEPRFYMPHEFTVFTEPSHTSEVIGRFAPQHIDIIQANHNQWIQIMTNDGPGWLFMGGEFRYLSRPMGFYRGIGDGAYEGLLPAGIVEVLAEDGDWILTHTDRGPRWVNTAFMPSPAALQEFFDAFPYDVSVFYKNIDTGFTFAHNENRLFDSASLNKATHALYLYHLAEQGLIDLATIYIYDEADYRGGTGVIRFMEFGRVFSHYELLGYSIRSSDNVAFRVLVEFYRDITPSYYDFVRSLGGDTSMVRNITGRLMSAAEAGMFMERIHEYLESGGRFSQTFKDNLLIADPTIFPNYPAAQKYGSWNGTYHNMAIIYAPSPFIMAILTNLQHYENRGQVLHEVTMLLEEFNNRYFSN